MLLSMADPSKFVPQEVFRCPHCQIRYAVTYIKTPTRDSGSAYCKTVANE
jgi:hypothetical protein